MVWLVLWCLGLTMVWGEAAAAEDDARPLFLWEVTKKGQTSHLFGTCHLPIPLEQALPSPHESLIASARVVVTEVDLSTVEADRMVSMAWRDDPSTLRQDMGEGSFLELARQFREVAPAPMLDRMKPWVVFGAMEVLSRQTSPATPILDRALAQRAQAAERPIVYLETTAQQVDVMDAIDQDIFVAALRRNVDDGVDTASEVELDAACRGGRLEDIWELVQGREAASQGRAMYGERNRAWFQQLTSELSQGDAFIAVGVGHMVGRTGLLQQLKRRGFKLTQVMRPASEEGGVVSASPSEEPLMLPGDSVSEPQSVDEARVEVWTTRLSERFPAVACEEGGRLRQCSDLSAEACRERVTADLGLCLDQWGAELPAAEEQVPEALLTRVGRCAISGLLGEMAWAEAQGAAASCVESDGQTRD